MNKENLLRIQTYFNELFPDARGELEYSKDYELLISVILSAQATDVSVNAAMRPFYKTHPTLESIGALSILELENNFKTIGLYKTKAANVFKTVKNSFTNL